MGSWEVEIELGSLNLLSGVFSSHAIEIQMVDCGTIKGGAPGCRFARGSNDDVINGS